MLTVSDEVRLARQSERGKKKETFESKPNEFQQRVNAAYPHIAKDFNIETIDASGTIDFERGGLGENKCLFRSGDTFSFSQSKYQRYFPNGDCFNDGSTSNVTVSFDSVTNTQATISFTF